MGGRRVCLSGGSVGDGSGTVSHRCRRAHMGTFVSPGADVAFHRPLDREIPASPSCGRSASIGIIDEAMGGGVLVPVPDRGKMSTHGERI
jgi:hypothetical protein